jgi:hypothetical protein
MTCRQPDQPAKMNGGSFAKKSPKTADFHET